MWSSLQQNDEAVFKPLKPLISKELAIFLLHGRVFSQGVFRGCSRLFEHGVFRVFRGVFTPLRCSIGNTIIETFACVGNDHAKVPVIAVLLLFLIGPAEELFWRGYVQRTMTRLFQDRKWGADLAFILTACIYALVHIWSFNFMLIMAALVAGLVWGLIYRICPKALPALIVSHALWDALVFVILPI